MFKFKCLIFSFTQLPGGVDLTLSELQDMAARQQQQIEHQQQVLVAKEQRLKYLKQQDQRQQHIIAEGDRLKKLRDRVESQEMKLKKLRALRGEVDKHRNTNGTLSKEITLVTVLCRILLHCKFPQSKQYQRFFLFTHTCLGKTF